LPFSSLKRLMRLPRMSTPSGFLLSAGSADDSAAGEAGRRQTQQGGAAAAANAGRVRCMYDKHRVGRQHFGATADSCKPSHIGPSDCSSLGLCISYQSSTCLLEHQMSSKVYSVMVQQVPVETANTGANPRHLLPTPCSN
jgi:hypothetical protein